MKRSRILVSGLINIETTVKIQGFPLMYEPVHYPFHGVGSTVSGVGYNISKALEVLGREIALISLVGKDPWGSFVESELRGHGISTRWVLPDLDQTAQSVILYDSDGRRQIHVDLKDLQERCYPMGKFQEAAQGCDVAVLCNINFSRSLLGPVRDLGIPVATDVHVLKDIRDPYNQDFMAASDLLFLSNEGCAGAEAEMARSLLAIYPCRVVVVGMGAKGALLAVRGEKVLLVPSVKTRPVVNTIGAGDALFSAFVHGWVSGMDPRRALEQAMFFASWKIGETGAANGFLAPEELQILAEA